MNVLGSVVSRSVLAVALASGISHAQAEEFPARPVKIIVQTAAGSSLDVMARLVAEPLSQMWGQQAIIVNQAGAGGPIVYVVGDGIARIRRVVTGQQSDGQMVVTNGLSGGESVVVEGQFQIEDGARVSVK